MLRFIYIFCSSIKAHSLLIFKEYKKDLESEVKKETSGDLKDILIQSLSGKRDKKVDVDKKKADDDAKALHEVCICSFHCIS